jgi:hypothetical protein
LVFDAYIFADFLVIWFSTHLRGGFFFIKCRNHINLSQPTYAMNLQIIIFTLAAVSMFSVSSAPLATVTAAAEETKAGHSLTASAARADVEDERDKSRLAVWGMPFYPMSVKQTRRVPVPSVAYAAVKTNPSIPNIESIIATPRQWHT